MPALFTFPNPVDEVSARSVAAGVVALCILILVLDAPALLLALAYGFLARVLTGPRLSPLGLLVTRVVRPRLPVAPRWVPGPPKRFAQGIGAVLSSAAVLAHYAFAATGVAYALVVTILLAASLEALFALCLGCKGFACLMRWGLVPEAVCVECSSVQERLGATASRPL